jgi:hypothetical protein
VRTLADGPGTVGQPMAHHAGARSGKAAVRMSAVCQRGSEEAWQILRNVCDSSPSPKYPRLALIL